MIVADASVVLKWFIPDEEGYEQAMHLKEQHILGKEPIVGPDLLLYEVANVLRIKRKELNAAREAFFDFCSIGVELRALGPLDLDKAMGLSESHVISTYDASYVVLSQALRCRFVTADEKLLARLKGVPHARHLREFSNE